MRHFLRVLLIISSYTILVLLSGCEYENSPKSEATEHIESRASLDIFVDYLKTQQISSCGIYESYFSKGESEYGYYPVTTSYPIEQGVLCAFIDDFDEDGSDEMLVISVKDIDIDKEGIKLKSLQASMVTRVDDKYAETASYTLSDNILSRDKTDGVGGACDIFIKYTGVKKLICIESLGVSKWFADGILWNFRTFTYADGIFLEETPDLKLYGSWFEDETTDYVTKSLKDLGFTGNYLEQGHRITDESDISILSSINAWFLYEKFDYDVFSEDFEAFTTKKEAQLKPIIIELNDYSQLNSLLGLSSRNGWQYD